MGIRAGRADRQGMHRTPRDRRAGLFLALILVVGTATPGPATAESVVPRLVTGTTTAVTPPDGGWADEARPAAGRVDRSTVVRGIVPVWRFEAGLADREATAAARTAAAADAAADASRVADAAAMASAAAARAALAASSAPAYVGKNHLWIPSLGLSRAVEGFACTRSTPPANRVYRWGCAGTNNVYLFGHAWGVMKPLHDGYVAGKVRIGMIAKFADASGKVRTYRVTEIRVVTPDQVDWAIASQPVASMTLQTCLGAASEHRLLVRLVADT